ncbi:hypothetical protein ES703_89181 [subsurface metagenome]
MSKKKREKIYVRFCPQCWKLVDLIEESKVMCCPGCGLDLYNKTTGGYKKKKRQQFESSRPRK